MSSTNSGIGGMSSFSICRLIIRVARERRTSRSSGRSSSNRRGHSSFAVRPPEAALRSSFRLCAGKPRRRSVHVRMRRRDGVGRLFRMASTALHPSASYSATLRVRLENRPGTFARLAEAVAGADGLLGAIDLVRVERGTKVRDVTVFAADEAHIGRIVDAVWLLDGIDVEHVSDRTFLLHLGGKLEVAAKAPLKTRDDLSLAYTPGVARVCRAIADEPEEVWNLTIKQNAVAVVTDGTA